MNDESKEKSQEPYEYKKAERKRHAGLRVLIRAEIAIIAILFYIIAGLLGEPATVNQVLNAVTFGESTSNQTSNVYAHTFPLFVPDLSRPWISRELLILLSKR